MNEVCPYCLGSGILTKKGHLVHDIEDWLNKFRQNSRERFLILKCHPSIADKLKEGKISTLTKLQFKYLVRIQLDDNEKNKVEKFNFLLKKSLKDITEEFS